VSVYVLFLVVRDGKGLKVFHNNMDMEHSVFNSVCERDMYSVPTHSKIVHILKNAVVLFLVKLF
jgi:predicted RNase H-related nuclease YkuK (DUF458 family)